MKNKLSIVIPCYNAEKYISKCLDSLLVAADKVGRKNCEIIVVNDGSTDSSLDILQQYQNDITILTTVNQGVSAARNYGIANIQRGGEYVWFVDADDEVDEYSLLYIHESLRQNPADCVFLGYEYVWGEKRAQVAKKELSPSELFYVLSGSEIIEKVMIPLF